MSKKSNLVIPLIVGGSVLGVVVLFRSVKASPRPKRKDVQLSPHFKLSEFLRSESVPEIADYEPTEEEIANLKRLCTEILEPIREKFVRPVRITSGLRPMPMKDLINDRLRANGYEPAADSDHNYGLAADITLGDPDFNSKAALFAETLPTIREIVIEKNVLHLAVKGPGRMARLRDDDLRNKGGKVT